MTTRASAEGRINPSRENSQLLSLARNTVIAALILLLLGLVSDVLLVIFGGILLGILLRALGEGLSRFTRLPMSWSLAVVILVILVIVFGVDYSLAPRVSHEFDELVRRVPAEFHHIENQLGQSSWGSTIIAAIQPGGGGSSVRTAAGRIFGIASTTFAVLADLIIIVFIGIYSAAAPESYVAGLVRLFSVPRRERIRQVLYEAAHTLRWWLIGRIISMLVIALMTGVGLWLIGVPIAFTLGLLAGIACFVPYVGSIASAIPSILIALTESTTLVLYVIGLYLFVHLTEGYILVPLMQKKMVHLPPALTLAMQAILGTMLGVLGIALASPLTAVAIVGIRMLYVEDVLHDTKGAESSSQQTDSKLDLLSGSQQRGDSIPSSR